MVQIKSLDSHTVQSLLKESLKQALSKTEYYLEEFLRTKDAESLHQYRVNIRAARSLCKEFGAFMEKKRQKIFAEQLKILQQETNAMRDVDVFLECIEAYKNKVEASCLEALEAIENNLIEENRKAYDAFSQKYTNQDHIISKLYAFLEDARLCVPKSEEKMFKHLRGILEERLEKIAKLSCKLTLDSKNERFHKLRLHYKKLRYTCDAMHLKEFAKRFKPIQTAFGRVQDKNTQIERIKQYNSNKNVCLEHIVSLLEEELQSDKEACVAYSDAKTLEKLSSKFHKIFTQSKD
jgi:CHAD domain-containing protein